MRYSNSERLRVSDRFHNDVALKIGRLGIV